MKYAPLVLSAFLAGCGASMPVAYEPLPCAPERTLRDEANEVYVNLDKKPGFIGISYGDFSQHFTAQKEDSAGSYFYGILYRLADNDNPERSVQFVDRIPLGTLDEVILCYKNLEPDDDCSIHTFPAQTDGELLNKIHKNLTGISALYFQNKREPNLELQLQQDYELLRSNESF